MGNVNSAVDRLERSTAVLDTMIAKRAVTDAAPAVAKTRRTFVAADVRDVMEYTFKTRECLLSPWLRTQSLNMVHAWRGVGKTHFSLNVAYAVASGGSWLTWKAAVPRKVLYLDGEMPGASIQTRLAAIGLATDVEPPPGYLRILTPDMQPDGITPNLATAEGREAVNGMIEPDTALIVVDNLSALVRGAGRENDADSWDSIATWALQLRARGHAVLFVHHSGKSGAQRGTSKREDILDSVLCLKRPADYDMREGARFEIHFEKGRDDKGDDVAPIEANLVESPGGSARWVHGKVEDAELRRAAELKNDGVLQADIAEALGKTRHQVTRLIRRAHAAGLTASASFPRGGARKAKSGPMGELHEEDSDE